MEVTNLIYDLTLVKSTLELHYIREAARISDVAMTRFASSLAIGRSELELAGEVYHVLLTSGSGLAASPTNLVSGDRETVPLKKGGCFTLAKSFNRQFTSVDC